MLCQQMLHIPFHACGQILWMRKMSAVQGQRRIPGGNTTNTCSAEVLWLSDSMTMQGQLQHTSPCALLAELGLHKKGLWMRECSCGSSRQVPWGYLAAPIPPWQPGQAPHPLPSLATLVCLPEEQAPSLQHAVSLQNCNVGHLETSLWG